MTDLEQKAREAAEAFWKTSGPVAYFSGSDFVSGYLAAAEPRESEIERWKSEANDKDTVPRSRYNALNADWLDATRAIDNVRLIAKREIEERDKEIAALRARVAELEGMVSEAAIYLDGTYPAEAALELRIAQALRPIPLLEVNSNNKGD